MKITASVPVAFTLNNTIYAPRQFDSKRIQFVLEADVTMPYDMTKLTEALKMTTDRYLEGAIVVQKDDPYLIQLLEPKSGATVHDYLNIIRNDTAVKKFWLLGQTTPPDTLNGFKVLVLGEGYTATLEGVAEFSLKNIVVDATIESLTLIDGDRRLTIGWSDLASS